MFRPNRTVGKSEIDALDLTKRVAVEAEITDARVAALDMERLVGLNTDLTYYASRYAWRQYLFNFLGSVNGKVILDIACGYSMTPVMFALAGARVYAIDVAPKTLAMVQHVAQCKGVAERVHVHVGPAEELPFEDAYFDLLYGGAALHHLQLHRAGRELARVLKPGGKGAFQDPLGHNPVLEFTRDYLAYRGKHPRQRNRSAAAPARGAGIRSAFHHVYLSRVRTLQHGGQSPAAEARLTIAPPAGSHR